MSVQEQVNALIRKLGKDRKPWLFKLPHGTSADTKGIATDVWASGHVALIFDGGWMDMRREMAA